MSRSINLSRKPRARMQKGFVRLLATISSLLCRAFRLQQQNCNHLSTDTAVGLAGRHADCYTGKARRRLLRQCCAVRTTSSWHVYLVAYRLARHELGCRLSC